METLKTFRHPLTNNEAQLIKEALLRHRDTEGNKLMWNFGDVYYVLKQLQTFSERGQVIEFDDKHGFFIGILLIDVGQLWWSQEAFLIEELVLCVQPSFHGFQRHAIKELNKLANEYHVKGICSGCLFQKNPQMVMNGYKKDGFDIDVPTAFKVVKF